MKDETQDESIATNESQATALGRMARTARKNKGWTLEKAGKEAGIGRSTLSKIENGQSEPSFEIVRRLSRALELDIPNLFLQAPKTDVTGRKDFTKKDGGEIKETSTYIHELLCSDLTSKRMLPYITTVKARSIADFPQWIRHDGEEFLYIISGKVEFHTEHYRPVSMEQGDSTYYDSSMGHSLISISENDAKVLWISFEP